MKKDVAVLFFVIWLATGATINSPDQKAFTLQQMGVDAIVSYGTFTLGHSKLAILKPRGDTFRTSRGILPAKQPGQFVTAAIPYFFLKALGISYESNYTLAAALVTWLSASLLSAVAFCCLYRVIQLWGYKKKYAAWTVCSAALCSHWLVYAGILHHDIIAASYLVIAFCCAEINTLKFANQSKVYALSGGIFAGLCIFTSMLPALIVLCFGGYIFLSRNRNPIIFTGIGFVIGVLPLLIYNAYYLGNPLTQANVAGNFSDTFFQFNAAQFMHHLNAYLGWGGLSIWKYAPIIALGFFGVALLSKGLRRVKGFVISSCLLQFFYLLNIETLGTCQYGPRYLLPLLPLCALGLAPIFQRAEQKPMEFAMFLGATVAFSLCCSVVGAWGGAMQCNLNDFMLLKYLANPGKRQLANLLLFWPLMTACFILLAATLLHRQRGNLTAMLRRRVAP